MTARLGVLTIGQSPRDDVVPTMSQVLVGVAIREAGALDGKTGGEITALAPGPGEYVLVTRLRDGRPVVISRERVLLHVQQALDRLAPTVDAVLFLCTGEFPRLHGNALLIEPSRVLQHIVAGLSEGRRLGVLVPLPEQVAAAEGRWRPVAERGAAVAAVSPYREGDFRGAAGALRRAGAQLIVMDCMGYTPEHKREVVAAAGLPTILAGTAVAAVVRELLL